MKCGETLSLGVYVLGAMDADERAETERHLADCPVCQDELVRLAPLPTMLSRLAVDEVAPIVDAPTVTAPVLTRPPVTHDAARPGRGAWRRRSVRMVLAAAAVAAAAVAAVAVLPVLDNDAPPSSAPTTLSAVDTDTGVRATAVLTAQSRGTHVALRLLGVPPGERCHLVIQASDGRSETSGGWTTSYASTVEVPVSTSIAPADITGLQVV